MRLNRNIRIPIDFRDNHTSPISKVVKLRKPTTKKFHPDRHLVSNQITLITLAFQIIHRRNNIVLVNEILTYLDNLINRLRSDRFLIWVKRFSILVTNWENGCERIFRSKLLFIKRYHISSNRVTVIVLRKLLIMIKIRDIIWSVSKIKAIALKII